MRDVANPNAGEVQTHFKQNHRINDIKFNR